MSELLTEKFALRDKWIIPLSHKERAIGMSTDKEQDRNYYAQVFAVVHKDRHGRHSADGVGRRIVACVNACVGVPIEILEATGATMVPPDEPYSAVKQQRNDLLAALKDASSEYKKLPHSLGYTITHAQYWDKLIAKIEAQS